MNFLRLLPLWSRRKRLIESLDRVAPGDLYGRSTASVIPDLDEPCHQALLACFMLAFSMPFERVGDMPAELTIAYMQGGRLPNWYFLRNGVYSYIETIIERMPAEHQRMCRSPIERVTRDGSNVRVEVRGGDTHLIKWYLRPNRARSFGFSRMPPRLKKDALEHGQRTRLRRWPTEILASMAPTIPRSMDPAIIFDLETVTLATTLI